MIAHIDEYAMRYILAETVEDGFQMAAQPIAGRGNTPPYVPYPSFKTLIGELREHGVPSRIDRSVLRRFSGIIGSQLLTTLRFLGLIDDQNHPTERLVELVAASNTSEWGAKVVAVLQAEYAPLFGLDLGNATALHFNETFRKAFPGSADSVTQKSIAFFLGAAKDSGIVIRDRVLVGRKTRAANGSNPKRRRTPKSDDGAKANGASAGTAGQRKGGESDEALPLSLNLDPLLLQLLRRIPSQGKEWPKEQRLRWFKTFAVNVSEVYDNAATPIDFKIELADALKISDHGE